MEAKDIKAKGKKLTKSEFDAAVKSHKITDPQVETFGNGYGEPYHPNRLVFGYLGGKLVWTETE